MDNALLIYREANRLFDEGKYIEAVQLAEKISDEPLKAAILIDAGFAISRPKLIKDGITLLEKTLQSDKMAFSKSSLLYNFSFAKIDETREKSV